MHASRCSKFGLSISTVLLLAAVWAPLHAPAPRVEARSAAAQSDAAQMRTGPSERKAVAAVGAARAANALPALAPVYSDDFSDPESGWPQAEDSGTLTAYVGGEYRMLNKTAGTAFWAVATPAFADIDVEVKARYAGQDQAKAYGLLFGVRDLSTFFAFEVNPVDGQYQLRARTAAGWTDLTDWTAAPAIARNGSPNLLRVTRRKDQVTLFVNGTKLETLGIPEITAGRIGLIAINLDDADGANIFFDDLRVYGARDRTAGLTVFLPRAVKGEVIPQPIPTAPPTPALPKGIFGRVTLNAEPAAGITLTLRQYDAAGQQLVAEATADEDGRYRFTGVPGLPSGKTYYVLFGPQNTNPRMVFAWYGPDMTRYPAGANQAGGDFDIGDVVLSRPGPNEVVRSPATFRWYPRPVNDTYKVRIFDPAGDFKWISASFGHAGKGTVNLPPGAEYGHNYGWTMRSYVSASSYGDAFFYTPFSFSGPAGQTAGFGATFDAPGIDTPRLGAFSFAPRRPSKLDPNELDAAVPGPAPSKDGFVVRDAALHLIQRRSPR